MNTGTVEGKKMSHKERPAYKKAMSWSVANYGPTDKNLFEIQEERDIRNGGGAIPVKIVKGMAEAYRLAQEHNADLR